MKTTRKFYGKGVVALLLAALLLGGCSSRTGGGTVLEFVFSAGASARTSGTKLLYIGEDSDMVTLEGTLEMDSGQVSVQVVEVDSGRVAWSGDYTQSGTFTIELVDLQAGMELNLTVLANEFGRVKLTLTSPHKLVQDREKPERYLVEKPAP